MTRPAMTSTTASRARTAGPAAGSPSWTGAYRTEGRQPVVQERPTFYRASAPTRCSRCEARPQAPAGPVRGMATGPNTLLSSVDARGPFFGFRCRGSRHPPSPCASRVGPRKCDRRRGREARRRARGPTFTVTRRMTCATGHGACEGAAAPIAHPPTRPNPSPRAWSLHHGSAIAAHLNSRRPARVVACPDAGTVRRPAFRRRARAGLAGFRRAVAGHGQPASAARSLQVVAVSRCRRRAVR